jgi:hypothetical protein
MDQDFQKITIFKILSEIVILKSENASIHTVFTV